MTLITCARPSLPRAHSPSFLTTRHARSNTRSTSIFMPSVISWNAASQSSNSSDASRPASKKPPEITWPSSPSLPLSYGYGKCPHYLVLPVAQPTPDRPQHVGIIVGPDPLILLGLDVGPFFRRCQLADIG